MRVIRPDPGAGDKEVVEILGALLLAGLAGASLVVQQALNANLRAALHSAVWSGFTSYLVGVICMALLALAMREPLPSVAIATRLPWHAWVGGAFGALYIGVAILLVPRLGAATFVALLVTGQMLTSVLFDQFGWLGLAQRPLDGPRVIGIALLIGGVMLVRR